MATASRDITAIEREVAEKSRPFRLLEDEVHRVIVGQHELVHGLLLGLLANGHILIEGVPGLAKTTAVAALASGLRTQFQRIQFTPDLLPADLVGTLVYRPGTGDFAVRKGPIFTNIVLADEINRAPAKVQSALLEAMQERQVTIGTETYPLPEPFLVLATQNPIEQEGTYPLPEAQVDRFMLKIVVKYPSPREERQILERMSRASAATKVSPVMQPEEIAAARAKTIEDGLGLASLVWEHRHDADRAVKPFAGEWLVHRQPIIARNVLRLGWYGFTHGGDAPALAIDEAVELVKTLSTEKSGAFVNAVLDRVAKSGGA
ncbi:MAG: AAA family ATPase, partial [Planctomycetota bacterium]